jgi:hypothetical protein
LSIHLEGKDLINTQQMEVAVNGPDGATHLILCSGIANLGSFSHETFTFLVGPAISRRQFVGVIASGALSTIQPHDRSPVEKDTGTKLVADLISIDANYDEESGQVRVNAEVSSGGAIINLSISYNVNILAELPRF